MTWGDVLDKSINLSQTLICDIFVNYSAHIDTVTINIFPYGWENDKNYFIGSSFRLSQHSPSDALEFINNTISNDNAEEHY